MNSSFMSLTPRPHPALYAAFDVYPSAKGAATHIHQAAGTLFESAGGGLLYVLGNEELPRYQREPQIDILRFGGLVENYLQRALAYSQELEDLLASGYARHLQIAQFRDPWSGIPLLRHARGKFPVIYEVNGLPSIELPSTYPNLGSDTLDKIRAMEFQCLQGANQIVVPSAIIRNNLIRMGLPAGRIHLVPNGTELVSPSSQPIDAPSRYILYFGAVQAWQGIDVLIRAWSQLRDYSDLELVICCSVKANRVKPYQKLAEKLGISDRIRWMHRLSRESLQPWLQHAYLTVAPLTECARNIDQGCCPLKILESMGVGTPVVASDLPVVRELIEHRHNGYLVPPDRPSEWARALRILLEYPQQVEKMGMNAQQTIANGYLWSQSNALLHKIHCQLLKGE